MKIALVALPELDNPRATPPLPLCYVAALLEQQRHIVRVYDLATHEAHAAVDRLDAVRAFRPHLTLVAADILAHAEALAEALQPNSRAIAIGLGMRDCLPANLFQRLVTEVQRSSPEASDEKNVIISALRALDDNLDRLPFPARHLLTLEHYPHVTPVSDLQTTALIGRTIADGSVALRHPPLLLGELRTIVREHGIHHVILNGPALTSDIAWMHAFLASLIESRLGIKWQGRVSSAGLTRELLEECRRAGCEALTFEFAAFEVLDRQSERVALIEAVQQVRDLGMRVNGHIHLEPQYSSIPALVDLAATFGLDEVRFLVARPSATQQPDDEPVEFSSIIALAREHYQMSRSRQYFIDRFGARLGTMIWHVGRAGLLGRYWQRHSRDQDTPPDIALERGQ